MGTLDRIKFDAPDLPRIAASLESAADSAPAEARKVVAKGLLQIKTGARRRVTGLSHAPAYPFAITFDTWETKAGPVGEVGPDKNKRQGALGNLIEFGSVNNPPRPHMIPEGDIEAPKFEAALQALAEKLAQP